MEGMARGRDGSTGEIRMGHDSVCATVIPGAGQRAIPLALKLWKGRKGSTKHKKTFVFK